MKDIYIETMQEKSIAGRIQENPVQPVTSPLVNQGRTFKCSYSGPAYPKGY